MMKKSKVKNLEKKEKRERETSRASCIGVLRARPGASFATCLMLFDKSIFNRSLVGSAFTASRTFRASRSRFLWAYSSCTMKAAKPSKVRST